MPLVEQELLTLPAHLSSPRSPVLVGFVLLDLSFSVWCYVNRSFTVFLFLFAIALSIPRFSDSDYLFGIFKLFFLLRCFLFKIDRRSLEKKINTVIVLSVPRFTDSDYPFGIFKLFFLLFTDLVVTININTLFYDNSNISDTNNKNNFLFVQDFILI